MALFYEKKSGFSLIEILLVLGITLSLAVGAFFLYDKVRYNGYFNETNRELTNMSSQALILAYNSGYDTYNAGANTSVTPSFPHDDIATGLLELPAESYLSWNGRKYKSPYGGVITTWIYQAGFPSQFYSYSINVQMMNFNVNSCIQLATTQAARKELFELRVGYGNTLIFYTDDRTGKRSKSEKEIKEGIYKQCQLLLENGEEPILIFQYA